MTIDEMRSALAEILINYDYRALPLANDVGIRPDVLKRFVMGISKPNVANMAMITAYFNRKKNRLWKKDRIWMGKKRMERI